MTDFDTEIVLVNCPVCNRKTHVFKVIGVDLKYQERLCPNHSRNYNGTEEQKQDKQIPFDPSQIGQSDS